MQEMLLVDTYLQILIIRRQSRWLAILIFLIVLFINDFVVILVELESPIDGARGFTFGLVVGKTALLIASHHSLLLKCLYVGGCVNLAPTPWRVLNLKQGEATHVELGEQLVVLGLTGAPTLAEGPLDDLLEQLGVPLSIPHQRHLAA